MPASAPRRPSLRRGQPGPSAAPDGEPDLDRDDARIRVEFPAGFGRMLVEAPELALAWRHTARRVFHTYFARGYRVVDVDAGRGVERPSYLLARREPMPAGPGGQPMS